MKSTFIYTLENPVTGAIRYVGKSDYPDKRAKSHLRKEPSTAKGRWVKSLRDKGLSPRLMILDEVPFMEWMFWEQHWIQVIKGWGFVLLNGDNGGLGHYRIYPETARKISRTLSGRANIGAQKTVSRFDLFGNFVSTFDSFAAAALAVNGSHGNIVRAAKVDCSAYGFLWRYGPSTEKVVSHKYKNGKYVMPEDVKSRISAGGKGRNAGKITTAETRAKQSAARLRYFARLAAIKNAPGDKYVDSGRVA